VAAALLAVLSEALVRSIEPFIEQFDREYARLDLTVTPVDALPSRTLPVSPSARASDTARG
jgi:hypothetical protein